MEVFIGYKCSAHHQVYHIMMKTMLMVNKYDISNSKDKEGYQHRRCYRGCVILLGLVWFTPESVIKEPNQIIMQSQLSLVEDLSAHSLPNLTKPNKLKHQC